MRSFTNRPINRLLISGAAVVLVGLAGLVVVLNSAPSTKSTPGGPVGTQPTVVAVVGEKGDTPAVPTLPEPTATELTYGTRVGNIAPDIDLSDIDGNKVSLSSLKGHPVWINFWATWCIPCLTEMPDIKSRYDQHKAEGLHILGVNLKEDPDTIRSFANRYKADWTMLLDWEGFGNTAAQNYEVSAIPVHLFVDKQGVIQAVNIGPMDGGSMDMALQTILPK